MCGISGVIPLDPTITNEQIFKWECLLLKGNKWRGREATGIASFDLSNGNIHIFKAKADADEFCSHITSSNIFGPVIGHNRAPTRGSPDKKDNNHPMFGKRYCLVHNGQINMTRIEYPYKGECDTEDLLSYIETYGIEEAIPMMRGSASIAVFNKETKDLILYRHENPLNLLWIPDKLFAFSSLDTELKTIAKEFPTEKIMGLFDNIHIKEFEEGTFFRINLETKETETKHIEIKK